MAVILVNGENTPHLPVTDRGLAYGDGLFETMAVVDGELRHWPRHLRRLQDGCSRLMIPLPDATPLRAEIDAVFAGAPHAVVKLTITRGAGQRGYRPQQDAEPTRIVQGLPWPARAGTPARLGLCATRLGRNPALAGLKHLNRLEQVLGAAELDRLGTDEALMRDERDAVIAGTRTNLFAVQGNRLLTPDLSASGIAGIMRGLVLERAAECGFEPQCVTLTLPDLAAADELFLTNALVGIWPVASLATDGDLRRFDARPATERLRASFSAWGLTP